MCSRYSLTSPPEAVRAYFGYSDAPNFPARYNVAPTQPIPLVRMWEWQRQFVLMRWGLLPSWVKDPKAFTLLINARSETAIGIQEKFHAAAVEALAGRDDETDWILEQWAWVIDALRRQDSRP